MARVIKLKESDITNIVRKIIREGERLTGAETGPTNPPPEWGGNKGDISKTHKGRDDYDKKITGEEVGEVFQAKSVMDVIEKYKKFYNTIKPEDRDGVATPDEVRRKGMKIIEDEGGDDPVALGMFLIWLGIAVIVYVASHYWPWQCC